MEQKPLSLDSAGETSLQNESFPHISTNDTASPGSSNSANQTAGTPLPDFTSTLNAWRDRQSQEQPDVVAQETTSTTASVAKLTNTQKRKIRRKQKWEAVSAAKTRMIGETQPRSHLTSSKPATESKAGGKAKASQRVRPQPDTAPSKRPREDSTPTLPSASKRIDNKATPVERSASYSSAVMEAELVRAVYSIKDNKLSPMDNDCYQKFFSSINEIMFEDIDDEFFPTFNGISIKRDVLRVVCKCSRSVTWLESMVDRLSAKTGLPLAVGEWSKVPWPCKFLVYFPYTKENNGRLSTMLKRCNPALPNLDWDVVRRKESAKGVHLLVKTDGNIGEIIRSTNGSLNFGGGKALLREFLPKRRSGTVGQPASGARLVIGETTDAESELEDMVNLSIEETGLEHGDPIRESLVQSSSIDLITPENPSKVFTKVKGKPPATAKNENSEQVAPTGNRLIDDTSVKIDQ